MKIKTIFISVVLVIISLSACSESVLKPDEQDNLSTLVKVTIAHNDYDKFLDLILEERSNLITEEKFDEFHEISTPGSSEKVYRLVEYSNGEMLLVEISPNRHEGEYKVYDVFIVPEELKAVFNRD